MYTLHSLVTPFLFHWTQKVQPKGHKIAKQKKRNLQHNSVCLTENISAFMTNSLFNSGMSGVSECQGFKSQKLDLSNNPDLSNMYAR